MTCLHVDRLNLLFHSQYSSSLEITPCQKVAKMIEGVQLNPVTSRCSPKGEFHVPLTISAPLLLKDNRR